MNIETMISLRAGNSANVPHIRAWCDNDRVPLVRGKTSDPAKVIQSKPPQNYPQTFRFDPVQYTSLLESERPSFLHLVIILKLRFTSS